MALDGGEVDLAIAYHPEPPAALRRSPLGTDRYVCIARPGHAALASDLTPAEFAGLRHVSVAPSGLSSAARRGSASTSSDCDTRCAASKKCGLETSTRRARPAASSAESTTLLKNDQAAGGLAAGRLDLRHDTHRRRFVGDIVDAHRMAAARRAQRGCGADATRCAGDHEAHPADSRKPVPPRLGASTDEANRQRR